jgi:ankyrin repeat protein
MRISNLGRALMVAAENGHAAAVSALLAFAKEHDIEQPNEYVSRTMMSKVIRNGHADVVKAWAPLDPGMLTRRVAHQNMLPLYEAVRQGRTGVAAALLDVGADPFRPNQNPDMQVLGYHKSMLSFAAFHRGPHMTEMLLARGLPIAGSGALHTAATLGQLDTMRLLMQHGADVNETLPTWSNWTPMHFAAKRGQIEAMKLLEENGAHSDVKDKEGKTPAQVLEEAKQ